MKRIRLFASLALLVAGPAWAQSSAHKGHDHPATGVHGGKVEEVGGLHIELVRSSNAIELWLTGHDGAAVDVSKVKASVLAVTGGVKHGIVAFTPRADHLESASTAVFPPGARLIVTLTKADGAQVQARFEP